ncbi:MAG: ABC transporter substrate-binding protein, partial [Chloroflexota bacterium]|nr:ABC transporter substrate-binding protein [Chloroflexota bacterium]
MRLSRIASLAVAVVLVAACSSGAAPGGAPSGSGGAAKTGADIIIGSPISLTGSTSNEGNLSKQGYDMWLSWINEQGGITVNGVKHKVQIKYEDDQSKPDLSAQLMQKLISEGHAQFILGPYGSPATASDAVIA